MQQRQLELGISVESTTEEDKQEEEVDAEAVQEEDVSESWDAEKQQQAVEVLLGSCAGNDFLESVEPTKVLVCTQEFNMSAGLSTSNSRNTNLSPI